MGSLPFIYTGTKTTLMLCHSVFAPAIAKKVQVYMGFSKAAVPLLLVLAGCGTVHPEKDFARAGTLIRERTGAEGVYTPGEEDVTLGLIESRLADGLTAAEAVDIALLNNKLFQSQFHEIGVSRADVVQSGLFANPALSFSARFPSGGGRANLSFGLAQEIVDLWQMPVRKRIAKKHLENTVSNVVALAIDLATRTQQGYVQIRVLEERKTIARDNLALLRGSEESASRRFDAGETSVLDVNLVHAEVLAATMGLEALDAEQAVQRAAFHRLLGLSRNQQLSPLTDSLPVGTPEIADDEGLITRALDARIDLNAAAAGLDAAEAAIAKERLAALPSLSVGAEGERTDTRGPNALTPLPTAVAALSARDRVIQRMTDQRQRAFDRSQSIDFLLGPSLQATLPLWDGNRAQIAKARYKFIQKEKEYADLVLGVVQEVTQANARARSAAALLRLSRDEALPLAAQNVETARRVYEAGEASIVALLLAQQNYNVQREANVQYAGDYATASFELERALGGSPSPESTDDEEGAE